MIKTSMLASYTEVPAEAQAEEGTARRRLREQAPCRAWDGNGQCSQSQAGTRKADLQQVGGSADVGRQ